MNSITEKIERFSFCDGQINSVSLDGDAAVLYFRSWQEKKYKFIFNNVAFFKCYEFGDDICEVHILTQSKEIDEAIDIIKSAGGKPEGYNNFSFYQINFEGCSGLQCIVIFLNIDIKEL